MTDLRTTGLPDLTGRRTLIAGVGNIFLSDDAFGVEVIARLARSPRRQGGTKIDIVDFGIRGVHLAYQLLEGYDVLVLVDAAPHGREPGTVSLVEVDPRSVGSSAAEVAGGEAALVDAHSLEPGAILRMLGSLGGAVGAVLVVACEPQCLEEGIGLSPPVAAAVDPAVELLERLIESGSARPSEAKEVSR